MKRFLLAALFAMAVGPTPAQAIEEPCQPYPYCCAWQPNPWQCLAGEADATSFPAGDKCTFNSATDVTREAGWQTGAVHVGPLVTLTDGTVHCKIIVNSHSHSSTDVRADVSFSATNGVVVGAGTLNYQATAADDVALCTTWDPVSGPTQYWNTGDATTGAFGHWSTDPNSSCGTAPTVEPNDPECSIWKALDRRLGTNIAEIWQDCEPYEEFPLPI